MSAFSLSREQLDAASCDDAHLLLIAPPGCGKTEVLAHRAAHQINSLERHQRVLALTFTNPATVGGESVILGTEDNVSTVAMFTDRSAPLPPPRGQPYAPGCLVGD